MASVVERTVATDRVAHIIRRVRRRWRARHALVGLGLVVGLTLVALWMAAMAMERADFSEGSITTARLIVALVVAAIALRWVAWPLLRRVTDGQVALYAEERLRNLEGVLMSAVEATAPTAPQELRGSGLTKGLVQDAVRRLGPHADGAAVEEAAIRRAGVVLMAIVSIGAAMLFFGPARLAMSLRIWGSAVMAKALSTTTVSGPR